MAAARGTTPSILMLSNMYPAPDNPMFGAFVEKQERALRELGVPFRLVKNTRWRTGALNNGVKYASLLVRTVLAAARGGFDVIIAHYLYPTAWLARIASDISGKPYVLMAHGTDIRSVQRRDPIAGRCRAALPGAALVVGVSEAIEEELREELSLPRSVPVAVINMGVDRETFQAVPDGRASLGLPEDARIVLFAGNFIRRKNLEVLIPAFDIAVRAGGTDLLLLAGGDPEGRRAAVEADVRDRGLGEHVRFLGVLEPHKLAAVMTAADVFVLPSVFEAAGVVLLEAMACGTPVVASRVGGIPGVVSSECGRLVPPTDVKGFAEAMAEVIRRGKPFFAEGCATAAAANDVREMTRRLVEAAGRAAGREV